MRALTMLSVALALAACDAPRFVPADAGRRVVGALPPPRPEVADVVDAPPVTLALRDVVIRNDGTRGWDLDARCTEPPEWDAECAPTNARGEHVRDLAGCRDDAFATQLAAAFAPLGGTLESALSASMALGVGALLVRITGWSGEPDDPSVEVELAPAVFGVPPGGARGDPLGWIGEDVFAPLDASVGADGRAVLRDPSAYVARGVLVARFESDPVIPLHGGDRSLTLRLTELLVTAVLAPETPFAFTLSGRWRVADLIAELDAAGPCRGDPLRTAAEIRARDAADVRARSRGGEGTGAACGALSVTLGLTAFGGAWGEPAPADGPAPARCPAP
ncbi:MAG: hypothetical protein KF729_14845 [Sandaracinaceae bacterium]|nr:hypothetical protein [Sandaracinaceae bacterium]